MKNQIELIKNLTSSTRELTRQRIRATNTASRKPGSLQSCMKLKITDIARAEILINYCWLEEKRYMTYIRQYLMC